MCPSDTYKVYKQGSNVRIDTTLLGFDHTNWQTGNRSYVFQGHSKYIKYNYFTLLIKLYLYNIAIRIRPVIRGHRSYIYQLKHFEKNGKCK